MHSSGCPLRNAGMNLAPVKSEIAASPKPSKGGSSDSTCMLCRFPLASTLRASSTTPVTATATDYISFNMSDPVLSRNKPLRQAMSMAFDRTRYVNDFWMGVGQPAKGIIPPTLPTYDATGTNPYTDSNLAAALELMNEAERMDTPRQPADEAGEDHHPHENRGDIDAYGAREARIETNEARTEACDRKAAPEAIEED